MTQQIAYDPDFDTPPDITPGRTAPVTAPNSIFDALGSRRSFILGFVTSILSMGTLGFLLLIPTVISVSQDGTSPAVAQTAPSAQVQKPQAAAVKTQDPTGKVPEITDADHIRGDKNAPVAFVEYSDIECPFCKRFHPTMLQMIDEYEGKVKWVYRHFPLSFHANAQKEAEATECANELGGNDAFWNYLDSLFERTTSNGTGFALDDLVPLAKELGLNETKFKECLDSGKYEQHVQEDLASGSSAGVTGTPGSFVIDAKGNAQLVSGALPYASIKSVIDAALEK